MRKYLVLLFLVALPLYAEQVQSMDNIARDFFASQYEDPIIEATAEEQPSAFSGLRYYRVYERKNQVEDPLIPDEWIRTKDNQFYRMNELRAVLTKEGIIPSTTKEALSYARELLVRTTKTNCIIDDDMVSAGYIPPRYATRRYYPAVEELPGGYRVTLYLYYLPRRFAQFFSIYHKNVVEYIITNQGSEYRITTGRVYPPAPSGIEEDLTQMIVALLREKDLIQSLEPYIQKRAIYGISDPSDLEEVNRRNAELGRLWKQCFTQSFPEAAALTRRVFAESKSFIFDEEYIWEETRESKPAQQTEHYRETLRILLSDIVQRERE